MAGTTQAAVNRENTRGRRSGGNASPTATYIAVNAVPAPRPCSSRPTTNTSIDPANPDTTSPATNSAPPTSSGAAAPRASDQAPLTTIPTTDAVSRPTTAIG